MTLVKLQDILVGHVALFAAVLSFTTRGHCTSFLASMLSIRTFSPLLLYPNRYSSLIVIAEIATQVSAFTSKKAAPVPLSLQVYASELLLSTMSLAPLVLAQVLVYHRSSQASCTPPVRKSSTRGLTRRRRLISRRFYSSALTS